MFRKLFEVEISFTQIFQPPQSPLKKRNPTHLFNKKNDSNYQRNRQPCVNAWRFQPKPSNDLGGLFKEDHYARRGGKETAWMFFFGNKQNDQETKKNMGNINKNKVLEMKFVFEQIFCWMLFPFFSSIFLLNNCGK